MPWTKLVRPLDVIKHRSHRSPLQIRYTAFRVRSFTKRIRAVTPRGFGIENPRVGNGVSVAVRLP